MAQALNMPSEHGHLFGDVPAPLFLAILLAIWMPRGADAAQSNAEASCKFPTKG